MALPLCLSAPARPPRHPFPSSRQVPSPQLSPIYLSIGVSARRPVFEVGSHAIQLFWAHGVVPKEQSAQSCGTRVLTRVFTHTEIHGGSHRSALVFLCMCSGGGLEVWVMAQCTGRVCLVFLGERGTQRFCSMTAGRGEARHTLVVCGCGARLQGDPIR